jgi:hypothetical protein
MSSPVAPSSEILDTASRQSMKRFLLTLALFVLWAQVPSSYSAAHALSLMAACAAGIDAAVALLAREPFLNASLNRWDVAIAFLGVYYGAQIVA